MTHFCHQRRRGNFSRGQLSLVIVRVKHRLHVIDQIGAIRGLAEATGTRMRYAKPHGALHNRIATDARQVAR
ncbi:LamB/YcsF family protein [Xaviernesmea oryzae]|uniref:LamB/YcsF family protein n=1 Tax=Xaviernesmea oryzae TaxID=464029 RepID=UPI0009F8BEE2